MKLKTLVLSSVALFSIKESYAMEHPKEDERQRNPKHFSLTFDERLEIEKEVDDFCGRDLKELKLKIEGHERDIEKYNQDIQEAFENNKLDENVIAALNEKEALINNISSNDAQRYANLSCLAYYCSDEISKLGKKAFEDEKKAIEGVLQNNINTCLGLEVVGIFHRNDGEFSGMALYDKWRGEVYITFAGSKSKADWLKDVQGWNQQASPKHGLFPNMNFHAGFLQIFEEPYESVYSGLPNGLGTFNLNTSLGQESN
jgi:hypothetical protein